MKRYNKSSTVSALMALVAMFLIGLSMAIAQVPVENTGTSGGGNSGGTQVQPVVPESIPIASPAVLKAYALTLVENVGASVYGLSVSGNKIWFNKPFESPDADPDKMAATVSSEKLDFSADSSDELTVSVSYDSGYISNTHFNIFYGSTKFKLVQAEGKWIMPPSATAVEMEMSDWIPFPVPGVVSACIYLRDEKGDITRYYNFAHENRFWTKEKLIFLGKSHVSQNGLLCLDYGNNTRVMYNLKDGQKIETVNASVAGIKPTIKGVRSVEKDTSVIAYRDTDEILRTTYTKAMKSTIAFAPGLARYPLKVYMIYSSALSENPNADWVEYNPWVKPIEFTAEPNRVVLIRFEYEPKPEQLPNPMPTDGGKG